MEGIRGIDRLENLNDRSNDVIAERDDVTELEAAGYSVIERNRKKK